MSADTAGGRPKGRVPPAAGEGGHMLRSGKEEGTRAVRAGDGRAPRAGINVNI